MTVKNNPDKSQNIFEAYNLRGMHTRSVMLLVQCAPEASLSKCPFATMLNCHNLYFIGFTVYSRDREVDVSVRRIESPKKWLVMESSKYRFTCWYKLWYNSLDNHAVLTIDISFLPAVHFPVVIIIFVQMAAHTSTLFMKCTGNKFQAW